MARLRSELALFDAGEWLRDLRAIGSPLGETREVFDLLPRATDEDWSDICRAFNASLRCLPVTAGRCGWASSATLSGRGARRS